MLFSLAILNLTTRYEINVKYSVKYKIMLLACIWIPIFTDKDICCLSLAANHSKNFLIQIKHLDDVMDNTPLSYNKGIHTLYKKKT